MEFKTNKSTKIVLIFLIIIIIIGFFFSAFTFWDKQKAENVNYEDYTANNGEITYAIDSIQYSKTAININGWALKQGNDINNYDIQIALRSLENDECIAIPTDLVKRDDVTEAYSDNYNYDNSGFSSKILLKKLKKSMKYEIYILYKNDLENYIVKTNQYVTKEGI